MEFQYEEELETFDLEQFQEELLQEDEPERLKKTRGANKPYDKVEDFAGFEPADTFVKDRINGKWTFLNSKDTSEGLKKFYKCSLVRASECPVRLYILLHAASDQCSVYRTTAEVGHAHIIPEKQDTTELRNKVAELFHSGHKKPCAIKTQLRQLKIKEPTVSQMSYWLKCLRTEIYGPSQIDLNYLKNWCIERSKVPDDEDEMFVAGFEVDIDKNWKPYFRFVCTTKRLLMLLKHNSLIASDGTYKLIWQGYPVLMSGTIDRDRKYHPAGICVAITETQVDYAFFFRTLRDVYFKIASVHFHADVLIGDAAPAITNGFVEVFGSCPKRVICWAHVIRNVDGKLKSIKKRK